MTNNDIFSGFLGAGKTTLIKKLIDEAYKGEKLVLIENEFGEIGIDGGFLQEAGIEITEMNSGCICCSLVGDFGDALKKVIEEYNPDRVLIEPSGVGKLSDVIKAVKNLELEGVTLNSFTTVADAKKCKMYMKNFGEFFNDQIENAGCIVLSHTQTAGEKKVQEAVNLIKEHNANAVIVTTDWDKLDGKQLVEAMEQKDTLWGAIEELHHHHHNHDDHCCCGHHHEHEHHHEECCGHHHEHEHHHEECCGHHHEHEHHHEECCCGHEHHHHDEHCCEHEHHHHDEHCYGHEHHHEHSEHCCCGHDHHEGHHHHHADEVFTSCGIETAKKFSTDEIKNILAEIQNEEKFGMILRAKGIVESNDGWIHFDYIPGEADVRSGCAGVIGRICVIGSELNEKEVKTLFE